MTSARDLFESVKNRRIEFKSGPFKNNVGAFKPYGFEGNILNGMHDNGESTSWAALWFGETNFENSHWKFAKPRRNHPEDLVGAS